MTQPLAPATHSTPLHSPQARTPPFTSRPATPTVTSHPSCPTHYSPPPQSRSVMDGQLFAIKQLLVLREQIAPFEADFAVVERGLDFSHMRDYLRRTLSGMRGCCFFSFLGAVRYAWLFFFLFFGGAGDSGAGAVETASNLQGPLRYGGFSPCCCLRCRFAAPPATGLLLLTMLMLPRHSPPSAGQLPLFTLSNENAVVQLVARGAPRVRESAQDSKKVGGSVPG